MQSTSQEEKRLARGCVRIRPEFFELIEHGPTKPAALMTSIGLNPSSYYYIRRKRYARRTTVAKMLEALGVDIRTEWWAYVELK